MRKFVLFVVMLLASPCYAQGVIDLQGAEPLEPAAVELPAADPMWGAFMAKMKSSQEYASLSPRQKRVAVRRVNRPWVKREIKEYSSRCALAMGAMQFELPEILEDGSLGPPPAMAIDWTEIFNLIWPYLLQILERWLGGFGS